MSAVKLLCYSSVTIDYFDQPTEIMRDVSASFGGV